MRSLPGISLREATADGLRLEFVLDADNGWLDGHFPGRPILPGVVQVGWAAHFAAELRADVTPPLRLERVKFKRPVLPGERLRLELSGRGERVRYAYWRLEGAHAVEVSAGVLCYGVPA